MNRFRFNSPGQSATRTFPGELITGNMVFLEEPSSIRYDPPGGYTSHLTPLINTDTTPPHITGTSFVIDNSKFTQGTSAIDVGVTLQDQGSGVAGEVQKAVLYIGETQDPLLATPVDITGFFDPTSGQILYRHDGENYRTYHYWLQTWDSSGNFSGQVYLGSRDTDNSSLTGVTTTVEDTDLIFRFYVAP